MLKKTTTSLKKLHEEKRRALLREERNAANIDYLAMMAGIDLPEDGGEEGGGNG